MSAHELDCGTWRTAADRFTQPPCRLDDEDRLCTEEFYGAHEKRGATLSAINRIDAMASPGSAQSWPAYSNVPKGPTSSRKAMSCSTTSDGEPQMTHRSST